MTLPSAAETVVQPLEVTRRPWEDLWAAIAHNRKALEFYQKLGFKIEGRLEKRIRGAHGGFEADIPDQIIHIGPSGGYIARL